MATLAEMMVSRAMDSTDPTKFNDTTQAFESGARIAMEAQRLKQNKEQLAQQKLKRSNKSTKRPQAGSTLQQRCLMVRRKSLRK